MTRRQDNSQTESSIDRRLFLGAAGALTLAAQPALAQGAHGDTKAEAKAEKGAEKKPEAKPEAKAEKKK